MNEAMTSVAHCPEWLVGILEVFQTASDLIGLTIIIFGFIVAAVQWFVMEIRLLTRQRAASSRWVLVREVRLFLGNYILIGLEFMIVSDIIHTFLESDLESLYQLGAIVVIRVAISHFLGKELEVVKKDDLA